MPSAAGAPRLVAIGASAGGLDACRHFLEALPKVTGFAFVLVQHLDPSHPSLLVELLATHTGLTVLQAADGTQVEAEHLYVIPPGTSLGVQAGRLVLSAPLERHGARLPFDFLLRSLAARAAPGAEPEAAARPGAGGAAPPPMAVVLSGTGEDGTQGALALRAAGGFVIAQEPTEAGFDGMPKAAIAAGAVDLVLPVAAMPAALLRQAQLPMQVTEDRLAEIIALLRRRAGHDFSLYKPGTLRRRIERRLGLAGKPALDAYLALLDSDPAEAGLLAKDLLIHVTGFFRDPEVFELLGGRFIPEVVAAHPEGQPMRVWVAGCSTGEETWSLAMLFQEAIAAAGRDLRLQIFASDRDADAVATARRGRYPGTIAADVSAARLARFFTGDGEAWQVSSALRMLVVFTVQDVLVDPPFSRLDLVSCRNLLIYLQPQAQAQAIARFRFALRPGGLLLLGSSETLGKEAAGFTAVAKPQRIWRRTEEKPPAAAAPPPPGGPPARPADRPSATAPKEGTPEPALPAALCFGWLAEHPGGAVVLVDAADRCLHAAGPIERHLAQPSKLLGQALAAAVRPALRARLRAALAAARRPGPATPRADHRDPRLEIRPVAGPGGRLLVGFLEAAPAAAPERRPAGREPSRIATLERELEITRAELRAAIQDLERAAEDQRVVNEEALSVNEEFQSTNEELLTSKEELQSLNEELNVLNGQLQETLEHSRTNSTDLQNVLFSTQQATLFLDQQLRIRFFTPATRAVFALLPGDIGRPLADLRALAPDAALLGDAAAVLAGAAPRAQEIATAEGSWYSRLVLPYLGHDAKVEGVVLTFVDITARRATAAALQEATRRAELASAAKSRFLGAASHDLRQPLQTLTLLRDLLAKAVEGEGEEAQKLVTLQEATLAAMSGMLDSLLDINQIESGTLLPTPQVFPVQGLLARLGEEYGYLARDQGLELRVPRCGLAIRSDPRLLEQMLRNLLSNALKYTPQGRILLGCRRAAGALRIEVWDTGIGIPEKDQQTIFDEYHQLGNSARQSSHGLGLGLSIVQRLAGLLGHPLAVRSVAGRGSVFGITVPVAAPPAGTAPPDGAAALPRRTGHILVVEDDPDVRALLERALRGEGHSVAAAADGPSALALVAQGAIRPEVILADCNLPGGMDGLRLGQLLRERLGPAVPVVILTADISTGTLRDIARHDYLRLHKPVRTAELAALLQRLLAATAPPPVPGALLAPGPTLASGPAAGPAPPAAARPADATTIHVVDDDAPTRDAIARLLAQDGQVVIGHGSGEAFLEAYRPGGVACLLVDAQLPGISGFDLLVRLRATGDRLPAIMITGTSDVAAAVRAMQSGAADFIEKPVRAASLRAAVGRVIEESRDLGKLAAWRHAASESIGSLTARQRAVMDRVLAGEPSKNIAADLGISQRTVEAHRAEIMRRTGAKSLPELARLALVAAEAAPALRPLAQP